MNYLDVRKAVEVDGCTTFVVTSDGEDAFVVRKKGNVYEANLKAFKQKVTDADTYAAALGKENISDGYHTTTLSADWPAATPEELARLFVEQAREKSDDAMLAITQNRSAGANGSRLLCLFVCRSGAAVEARQGGSEESSPCPAYSKDPVRSSIQVSLGTAAHARPCVPIRRQCATGRSCALTTLTRTGPQNVGPSL